MKNYILVRQRMKKEYSYMNQKTHVPVSICHSLTQELADFFSKRQDSKSLGVVSHCVLFLYEMSGSPDWFEGPRCDHPCSNRASGEPLWAVFSGDRSEQYLTV